MFALPCRRTVNTDLRKAKTSRAMSTVTNIDNCIKNKQEPMLTSRSASINVLLIYGRLKRLLLGKKSTQSFSGFYVKSYSQPVSISKQLSLAQISKWKPPNMTNTWILYYISHLSMNVYLSPIYNRTNWFSIDQSNHDWLMQYRFAIFFILPKDRLIFLKFWP